MTGEHVRNDKALDGKRRGDASLVACFMLLVLLLATGRPPLQMEIRLTPSALSSANKDKEPRG
jgi:hypothetical protein